MEVGASPGLRTHLRSAAEPGGGIEAAEDIEAVIVERQFVACKINTSSKNDCFEAEKLDNEPFEYFDLLVVVQNGRK